MVDGRCATAQRGWDHKQMGRDVLVQQGGLKGNSVKASFVGAVSAIAYCAIR